MNRHLRDLLLIPTFLCPMLYPAWLYHTGHTDWVTTVLAPVGLIWAGYFAFSFCASIRDAFHSIYVRRDRLKTYELTND